jgi:hypothetical protein
MVHQFLALIETAKDCLPAWSTFFRNAIHPSRHRAANSLVPYIETWQDLTRLTKSSGHVEIPVILDSLTILAEQGDHVQLEIDALVRFVQHFNQHVDLPNCEAIARRAHIGRLKKEIDRIRTLNSDCHPTELTPLVNLSWEALTDDAKEPFELASESIDLTCKCDSLGQTSTIKYLVNKVNLNELSRATACVDLIAWCCDHNDLFRKLFVCDFVFVFNRIMNPVVAEKVNDIYADCVLQLRDPTIISGILNHPIQYPEAESRVAQFFRCLAMKFSDLSVWLSDVFRDCKARSENGRQWEMQFCQLFQSMA